MAESTKKDARKIIKTKFVDLLYDRPITHIRVSDLCSESRLSRTSFYNYYESIHSILNEMSTDHLSRLKSINSDFFCADFKKYTNSRCVDFFDETLSYIKNNKNEFKVLLSNNAGNSFLNGWKNIIRYDLIKKVNHEKIELKNEDLFVEMLSTAALGCYCYWMDNYEHVSIEDIRSNFHQLSQGFIYRNF